MKTGFAKVCINPLYDTPISGYYEERYTKGILDDIHARVTAFDDGERKALVIGLDLISMESEHFDAIKASVNELTGVDKDAIFINCSHTHTGPQVGKNDLNRPTRGDNYDKFLVTAITDACIYALDNLKESTIETAETEVKGVAFIRRFRMKDGTVATNPGVNNPDIDHALGTPNETVKLIKIKRDGGDDIFIVNFGNHPDSVGGEYISADYIGFVCSIIENAVPNTKCMFLLAPQGDVNHINVNPTEGERAISKIDFDGVPRSIEHAQHMGRIIAGAVLSVCSITEKIKADKISYASKIVNLPSNQENDRLAEVEEINRLYKEGRSHELPYKEMQLTTIVAEAARIVRLKDGPESFPFVLSAIKIGDMVFAGIGGEVFTDVGREIYKKTPFDTTILCCLTNSTGNYIPSTKAYDEGGYEVVSSPYKKGCGDLLADGMTELLTSLK